MGTAGVDKAQGGGAVASEAAKKMYTDDEIRRWQPLMPLDRDRLTTKQMRMIMAKMYMRSFIVYDSLAEH